MFGHDGWMGFGGGFMWVFWILLIVIVVWAVKAVAGGGSTPPSHEESPMEILKKRYARGEIDEEEFERRRKELER
jgi:putative membrane protein